MGVVDQVAVLLLLILIGYLGRRFRAVDEAAVGIFTTYILTISLPALILVSLQRPFSRDLLGSAGIALALSSAMYAALFALAVVYPALLGLSPRERGVHRYAFIFSNVGFMGYPVVEAVLGREALFHLAIFNIPFTFLAFSIGAWLIAKEGQRPLALSWKTFVNPSVVATLFGFVFFIGSVRFPYPVLRTLSLLGDTMTPLSMVVIGAVLGSMEPRRVLGNPRNYVTILVRLLVLPALLGGTLYALGFRGLTLALPTLVSAMPVAANTTLLAALYEGDVHSASSMVFLSTLFCVLTIPLVALLLGAIT